MYKIVPVSRRKLVRKMRSLGFDGPYPGSDHEYMVKGDIFVIIPNPHRGDIGIDLIKKILKHAEIDRGDWFSA